MWTIENLIQNLDLKLVTNHKLWCHFTGYGFDIFINLDTRFVKGNYFNFHSYKSNFKGNFKAEINSIEEFKTLMKLIK